MPLILSCWRLQIGQWQTLVSESWFDIHMDTNYYAHGELIIRLNICSYSYICHILIFKLDDAMPVIQSCWRIQITVQETIASSHDLVSTLIQIIVSIKMIICLNIRSYPSYICRIFTFELDDVMPMIWSCWWIQISVRGTHVSSRLALHIRLLCISLMWNMMPKLSFALPLLHGS
jgi:hypothetical protein